MGYAPFAIQTAAHRALLIDNYKRAMLYWSRRTGKTLWSLQQIMWSSMLRQGQHFIVFKEYQQAETVAWNQYLHLIPKQLINGVPNKSTLTVNFQYFDGKVKFPWCISKCHTAEGSLVHTEDCDCSLLTSDRSKPPSSLRLLGSDKAESHRGNEAEGMIFDEYQDQDPTWWAEVYSKFFATTDGWAAFMGTAKPYDWWNDQLEYAEARYTDYGKGYFPDSKNPSDDVNKRWFYSKATYRENPRVTPEWVARDREEAEAQGKLGVWLQEMELIPFTLQGAVYSMFDKKLHNIKQENIPDEGTNYVALDFGFAEGHPAAAAFIRVTRDDVWYQWDEIHGTGIQIDELIAEINMKMDGRVLAGIVADSARPDLIDYMATKGMPVIPAPKKQNSVPAGIQLLAQRLKPKIQLTGDPKPGYYIDMKNCPKTTYDWVHYRYKEVKKDRHPMELPEKKFDDSLDAIRYLALHFKYGMARDDKPLTFELTKATNEYGLI